MSYKKLTEEEYVKLVFSKKNQEEYWQEKKESEPRDYILAEAIFSSSEKEFYKKGFPVFMVRILSRGLPDSPLAKNVLISYSSKTEKDGHWSSSTDMGLPFELLTEVQKLIVGLVDNPPTQFKD